MNKYDLKGKVALITGAGQGIGRGAAQAVAQSGASVILCGRTMDKLVKAAAEIEDMGVEALPIKMDVSKIDDINNAVDKAMEKFGHIDILLNCAGIWAPSSLADMTPEFWDEIHSTNLRGGVFVSRAVTKHMMNNGIKGTLVFTSSQAGLIGEPLNSAYSSSKSAMSALVQSLALELAEYNINVVGVAPGFTNSEMMQNLFKKKGEMQGKDPKVFEQEICDLVPLKRMAEPYEVGSLMAFLASEEASYITGVTLTIAGGNILV